MNRYLEKLAEKAVLVMGNPHYLDMYNGLPSDFYDKIEALLKKHQYEVERNEGKPYTKLPEADLYVGHSRGASRLNFVGPSSKVIRIGDNTEGSLNHPKDKAVTGGVVPDKYHFMLSKKMQEELERRI